MVSLSLVALLEEQGRSRPDQVAIAGLDRRPLCYGRLHEHVVATIRALNELGIGREDRVAIVLPNGPEMATAFLAVSCAATCAPLNPTYRAEEIRFYLTDLQA